MDRTDSRVYTENQPSYYRCGPRKIRGCLFDALTDFDWEAWNKDGKSVIIGVEIVPQIITQNGGSLARDILRVKIEERSVQEDCLSSN